MVLSNVHQQTDCELTHLNAFANFLLALWSPCEAWVESRSPKAKLSNMSHSKTKSWRCMEQIALLSPQHAILQHLKTQLDMVGLGVTKSMEKKDQGVALQDKHLVFYPVFHERTAESPPFFGDFYQPMALAITFWQRVRSKVRKWAGYIVYSPHLGKDPWCDKVWIEQGGLRCGQTMPKPCDRLQVWFGCCHFRGWKSLQKSLKIPATQTWAKQIWRGATDLFSHQNPGCSRTPSPCWFCCTWFCLGSKWIFRPP